MCDTCFATENPTNALTNQAPVACTRSNKCPQVRHFKDYHGVTTKNVKEVAPKVKTEYQSYAPYQR